MRYFDRAEVPGALASELQLDTANPKWRIPSDRMKRKNREQIVPLSTQAVALFRRALELKAEAERDTPGERQVGICVPGRCDPRQDR